MHSRPWPGFVARCDYANGHMEYRVRRLTASYMSAVALHLLYLG